jgi:hypothetical protein
MGAIMSRTTLSLLTAGILATLSLGIMAVRHQVMGQEIHQPAGPGTYKVTLLVRGKSLGNAKVQMLCPLDFKQQHAFREEFVSAELMQKPVEGHSHDRRQVTWWQKTQAAKVPLEARYEFYCSVDMKPPTAPMTKLGRQLYEAPHPGEDVQADANIDPHDPAVAELAKELTDGHDRPVEQVRELYQFVNKQVASEPAVGNVSASAVECLKAGHGDAAAKSRLLAALCRSRGIPARLVVGVALGKQQTVHTWVEAWLGDHWMPMCPFHGYCGRVPATYLVFGFGDVSLVRGHNIRDFDYACLVEHKQVADSGSEGGWLQKGFRMVSLEAPPPGEEKLVEFLLLLPVAALIICICRNLIGMSCFGTFAPALIGLAFREWESLPGILVFVSIILIGWGLRHVLDRYHLLQVPRTSFLLSMVVIVLLATIVTANIEELAFTRYFSLFPMVILTGMIERFWTLETEDSTTSSFKTLVSTMLMAAVISVVCSRHLVVNHLMHYPETLGVVMALQLVLGRYTGYRLSELFRFRDFAEPPVVPPGLDAA